ncbi:Biopolymer transport protein ExbB [Limihaloglobus sulfuriphilus]|uniref:Biopolymer transport protein ExbB n=1 Tax=Limihaloglobus sulfuriphilus TaxID=1851148 RepID=A0A1Q2MCY3_9BACT|nr:MotA/TolQ/ExbB proton channel family protein [Limihaloglobus sulfuriphilus]AQQ70563.1 Biopolymer transport protein ExbB [Limihaloglobus sulfuriphilus]
MKNYLFIIVSVLAVVLPCASGYAREASFENASESIRARLDESLSELALLREKMAQEKIPLSRKLRDLESQLVEVRLEYQQATRLLDSRTLDLSNLKNEIDSRRDEGNYLSNLLGEYIRNFESRLHISEIQRYRKPLEEAKLAAENTALSQQQVYNAQAAILELSLERLYDALNGTKFDGTASDSSGSIHHGTFAAAGPVVIFQSDDGKNTGTAQQRLGSLEAAIIEFRNPDDTHAAAQVVQESRGFLPLDPTLGNAHKIEDTHETFIEHVKKGGVVMYPIFAMAGAALLVAVYKWIAMSMVRTPSRKKLGEVMNTVTKSDQKSAMDKAAKIRGPVGRMLRAGVEHMKEPRELVEEVMYEQILSTRLKLERWLSFIAICAASAPLLGLLGTVTGIINTFKLITVFGSGDVKTLSGGISEALITTEFGLIVAIPSLLIHAFLSRRAKSIVNQMEQAAMSLVNQISKTPYKAKDSQDDDSEAA